MANGHGGVRPGAGRPRNPKIDALQAAYPNLKRSTIFTRVARGWLGPADWLVIAREIDQGPLASALKAAYERGLADARMRRV